LDGELSLESDLGEIRLLGQLGGNVRQPLFRPAVPLTIYIPGRSLTQHEVSEAVEAMRAAAEAHGVTIVWPASARDLIR
jgi:hypothetical protein